MLINKIIRYLTIFFISFTIIFGIFLIISLQKMYNYHDIEKQFKKAQEAILELNIFVMNDLTKQLQKTSEQRDIVFKNTLNEIDKMILMINQTDLALFLSGRCRNYYTTLYDKLNILKNMSLQSDIQSERNNYEKLYNERLDEILVLEKKIRFNFLGLRESVAERITLVENQVGIILLLLITFLTFLIYFILFWFQKRISRPLSYLNKAIDTIINSDFETEIKLEVKDEFYLLGQNFNKMRHQIKEKIDQLEFEIDKRKKIVKSLRQKEQDLRKTQKIGHLGSWEWNLEENSFLLSEEMSNIYEVEGKSKFNNLNNFINHFIYPDDKEIINKRMANINNEISDDPLIFRIITGKGNQKWVSAQKPGVIAYFPDNNPKKLIGTVLDITMQKKMEIELKKSKENLELFLNTIDDFIFVLNTRLEIVEFNPVFEKRLEYTKLELFGMSFMNLYLPEIRNKISESMKLVFSKHSNILTEPLISKNKKIIDVEIKVVKGKWYGEEVIFGIARDVTERKKMERELKAIADRLSKVMIAANDGMYDWNILTNQIFFDERYYTMAGYSPNEFPGNFDEFIKHIHPRDIENVKKVIEDHFLGKTKQFHVEFRFRKKDQNYMWILGRGQIVEHDKAGKPARMVGTHTDITKRKQLSEEMQKWRKLLDNIVNSMPSIIISVNPEGKILLWNSETEKATGVRHNKAKGKHLDNLFPHFKENMEKINDSIKSHEIKKISKVQIEINNQQQISDVTIFPLVSNGIEGAVIRIDDITEQMRLEEMMIQSEKMMSVGGLAAGMAHEINNPLAGIIQNVQVMENRLTGNFPMNKKIAEKYGINFESLSKYIAERDITGMLKDIKDAGLRASTIVKNMLGFSRKSDESFSLYGLPDLFDKTLKLASTDYDLRKKYDFKVIKITKQIKENIPNVQCEAAKIQQVLLNILRNGAQAMFEAETEKPEFIFKLSHDEMKNIVILEIEDNGPGMDEDIRKRIFEPFFTTKAVGEGTGLGLSVSYFIITENHGGEMYCESEKGKGTRFVIKLPVNKNDDSNFK